MVLEVTDQELSTINLVKDFRLKTMCIGCGLGPVETSDPIYATIRNAISQPDMHFVVDADGIKVFMQLRHELN